MGNIAWRLQGQKRQDMLHEKLQHYLLRRRKDNTIKEQMPKKLDHIVFCELSELQLAAYRCDCVAIPGLCSQGDCCGRLHVAFQTIHPVLDQWSKSEL